MPYSCAFVPWEAAWERIRLNPNADLIEQARTFRACSLKWRTSEWIKSNA